MYQDVGQVLRAGNPRLARIDVSKPGFLARRDLPPVVLLAQLNPPQLVVPLQQVPLVAVPVAEGVASSSHLSFEDEIDRFQFVEERTPERLVEILNSETEFDRLSTAHQPGQAVAFIETSSEEVEAMDLKKRPSLRGLMASRGKGATPLEAPKVQTLINLPPPPPLPLVDQGLRPNLDPKKKRPIQELEEGEMLPQKGAKQQKARNHRDKRSKSMESRDDVEVRRS